MVQLTYRCHLSCKHCSYGDLKERPSLDMKAVETFLDQHSPVLVKLSGGEPTISPIYPAVIEMCKERGIRVVAFTNGQQVPDIDPDAYWVSLYGERAWHSLITQNGSFDKVIKFIKTHQVDYLCSPVFSQLQIFSLEKIGKELNVPLRLSRLLEHGLGGIFIPVLSLEKQRKLILDGKLNDPPNLVTCSLGFPPFKCNRKACLKADGLVIPCTSMVRGKVLCPYMRLNR